MPVEGLPKHLDANRSYLAQFLEWREKQDLELIYKDCLNRFRTNSLFLEFHHLSADEAKPVFTNKPRHCNGCWSFPLLYLEIADVTESDVGEKLLYNYDHFCKLAAGQIYRKMLNSLRDTLERRVRAEALQRIKHLSRQGNDGTSLAAAKFLVKREWVEDKKQREAILRDKVFADKVEDEYADDFKLLEEGNEPVNYAN